MTKFKEYLKDHGIKVHCDYEAEYCHGIVEIATCVLDNGVAVGVHHESMGYHYAVYNRSGDCSYFNHFDFDAYLEDSRDDVDYIYWLHEMEYDNSERAYAVMRYTYLEDAKVRIAFKHMKAGIMDKEVFRKWHVKHCLEYAGIL